MWTLQYFAHKKLKKPPSKVAQKNSNPLFFPYCPELPKRPKQKNSCSKLWLIDQLYIELRFLHTLVLTTLAQKTCAKTLSGKHLSNDQSHNLLQNSMKKNFSQNF